MSDYKIRWKYCSDLREKYRDGQLSEDQIARLKAIGFDFGGKAQIVERNNKLIGFLQENPHMYTYKELSSRHGMSEKQCYAAIHNRGLGNLVKPARKKVNAQNILSDYDAGASISDLALRYDLSKDYIRRVIRESGRKTPKFLQKQELEKIRSLRESGKSIVDIVAATGRCAFVIRRELKQMGFCGDGRRLSKEEIEEVEKLILTREMTYKEIAKTLGTCATNVERIAKSIGFTNDYRNGSKYTRCIETGEVFPSAVAAQRSLCPSAVNGSRISRAIRLGKPYRGYHWEYVDTDEKEGTD